MGSEELRQLAHLIDLAEAKGHSVIYTSVSRYRKTDEAQYYVHLDDDSLVCGPLGRCRERLERL